MVSSNLYAPSRGDLVWISFDPQAGREQAGLRPALVLSPYKYNHLVGLALMCPITSRIKNYPYEVRIENASQIKGVVLSDQIKSVDWRARKVKFAEKCPQNALEEVLLKIGTLLN